MSASAAPATAWDLASWTLEIEGRAPGALVELDAQVAVILGQLLDKAARHRVLALQLQLQIRVRGLERPDEWEIELDAGEQRGQDGSIAEWYHFTLERAPRPRRPRKRRDERW